MHTETYIADDNATLISKNFRDLKKYLDMVSHGQISIPYLTRFKKVIINNARSDFCVDEVKLLLSRGILQDAEAVEIKNPDDRFCTIDGMLYSGNKQKLYLCPRGKTGNLVIHDGAELICDYACAWVRCDQVTIPDSVKSIGENAFAFNLNLKKVEGGRNIQNIKPFAFYRCYRLKRFEFGEKLKIIGSSAFDYASLNEMKEIKFPTDGDEEVLKTLPTEMDIPNGIDEEGVADWLSDETGFCVFGFVLEAEKNWLCSGNRKKRQNENVKKIQDRLDLLTGKKPLQNVKDLKKCFVPVCTNGYSAVDDGEPRLYRREDLTQWAKEAFKRGEKFFYAEPVNPNHPYGRLRLTEPNYVYRLNKTLTKEEFDAVFKDIAD